MRIGRIAVVSLVLALAFTPASSAWTFSDADWHGLGEVGGVDGVVYAWAVKDTNCVYAGGAFTSTVDGAASRVAMWNGSSWTNVGEGLGGTVNALLLDGAGDLYAAGEFTNSGGTAVNRIAKWDGTSWSGLGSGMNGPVNALATDDVGRLYAAGSFSMAGGQAATNVAMWENGAWTNLGIGVNSRAYALAVQGTNLYIGGDFTSAGGVAAELVARWDGNAWTSVGTSLIADGGNFVQTLLIDAASNLYAGGYFEMSGVFGYPCVAKWDGGTWTDYSDGMEGPVAVLKFDNSGKMYAGGVLSGPSFYGIVSGLAYREGNSWSSPNPYGSLEILVLAIASDATGRLYLGGSIERFIAAGGGYGVTLRNAAMLEGNEWRAMGGDVLNGVVYALTQDGSGKFYAGGAFTYAGIHPANSVAMWDGVTWTNLGSGVQKFPQPYVLALATDPWGSLYAGGSFTNAGGVTAANIAKWNGAVWTNLGSGVNGYVSAMAVDDLGNLYVGGEFSSAGDVAATNVARWNGSEWSSVGSGVGGLDANLAVQALVADREGNLYAGGGFTQAGDLLASRVAQWDGIAWTNLGTGVSGDDIYHGVMRVRVSALACDDTGNLYASGGFTNAGGAGANSIAKWDGSSSWTNLGAGLVGPPDLAFGAQVYAIALGEAGNLYAAGSITNAGGVTVHNVAKWSGGAWTNLGSGLGGALELGYVRALAHDRLGRLYAAGQFTKAGGQLTGPVAYAQVEPVFPMTAILPQEDGNLAVEWSAFTTDVQYLEVSESLVSNDWKVIATNEPPSPPTNAVSLSATNGARYFRVRNAW